MISGHIKHGNTLIALEYFSRLLINGLESDEVAFVAALHACAILENAQVGKQVHALLLEIFADMITFIGYTLVDMYAKCGSIKDAQKVFNQLPARNVVSWNSLLAGYAKHELIEEVFILFEQMQFPSVSGNNITFISILNACVTVKHLKYDMAIHGYAMQAGIELSVMVGNTLASMYANCGSILDAQVV